MDGKRYFALTMGVLGAGVFFSGVIHDVWLDAKACWENPEGIGKRPADYTSPVLRRRQKEDRERLIRAGIDPDAEVE